MPDPSGVVSVARVGATAVPSRLSRRLEEGRHPDALRAFRRARHGYLDGERLDMGALATELGVDRTTLFRWVGNRDALLAEVLWSIAVPAFDHAVATTTRLGDGERVVEILCRFIEAMLASDNFREYLRREPARALRMLTTAASPISSRYRVVITQLLEVEYGARIVHGMEIDEVAYLLGKVSESFTYADIITGEPPSLARARRALSMVLRVDDDAADAGPTSAD